MRQIGMLHNTQGVPVPPDQVTTFIMTGGSSAQASDWISSGSTAAPNAQTAGVHIIRIIGQTTLSGPFGVFVNLMSTGAAIPASGTSVASSGVNHAVNVSQMFQIPGGSTGYSIAAFSSGYVTVEQWRK
jgi:hypothetical protein